MTTKLDLVINQGEDTSFTILCFDDVGPIDLHSASRCELMVRESVDGPMLIDLTLDHGLTISPDKSHKLDVLLTAHDTTAVAFIGPWLKSVYNCEVDSQSVTVQVQEGRLTLRRDVVMP